MTNNIDQVLNRGEKLDNLVTKSEQLGDQVKSHGTVGLLHT